jgi:hypothetical protein
MIRPEFMRGTLAGGGSLLNKLSEELELCGIQSPALTGEETVESEGAELEPDDAERTDPERSQEATDRAVASMIDVDFNPGLTTVRADGPCAVGGEELALVGGAASQAGEETVVQGPLELDLIAAEETAEASGEDVIEPLGAAKHDEALVGRMQAAQGLQRSVGNM